MYPMLKAKHGPGATADRLRGNQKWTLPTWTERLEHVFPYVEYALPNLRWFDEAVGVKFLKPEEEQPAKLVVIPKTSVTPRLISEEPTCMQYMQQALWRELRELLESDQDSKWFVGFSEQWPNQAMAEIGSEDRSLATLDLSEASDRVPNWLVEDLYSDFPHFLEGIQACRSTAVRMPSGDVIHLQKFASMGSAVTFPIEAMVFAAIVLERCLTVAGLPLSRKSIRTFRDRVRVYGDDIIVPTDMAESVVSGLETFGFKVNEHKSFWTGGFRESCGAEFWEGTDVSIVRFRKSIPTTRHHVDELVSCVATRNQFFEIGLWGVVELLDDILEPLLTHKGEVLFPYTAETSPLLGRRHPFGLVTQDEWDADTQSLQTRGWMVSPRSPKNAIDGHHALMKCLAEVTGTPMPDREHLTRSGRPRDVSIYPVKAPPK
jgi:hypothetical protein